MSINDEIEKRNETREAMIREAHKNAKEKVAMIMAQREEIMTAFIAKYKCEPDEMVQVESQRSPIEKIWFVVRKSDSLFCAKCQTKLADGQPKIIGESNDKSN